MTCREKSFTKTGRRRTATFAEVCQWIVAAWNSVKKKSTITNGFLKAGLLRDEEDSASADLPPITDTDSDNDKQTDRVWRSQSSIPTLKRKTLMGFRRRRKTKIARWSRLERAVMWWIFLFTFLGFVSYWFPSALFHALYAVCKTFPAAYVFVEFYWYVFNVKKS